MQTLFLKLFLGIVFTIEVINGGDLICKFCGVSQEFCLIVFCCLMLFVCFSIHFLCDCCACQPNKFAVCFFFPKVF